MNITLTLIAEMHDHQGPVREIATHKDGKLFFARSDEMLLLYDLKSARKLRGFYDSPGYSAAQFGADGRNLIFQSGDRVHYFDLASWQERMTIVGELTEVREVDAHLDAGIWAMADDAGTIQVRSLGADEMDPPEYLLEGHTGYVEYLAFHPSGKILASGSADHTIRFWDMETKTQVLSEHVPGDFVTALAFSPDGTILLTGDYGGRVKIWKFQVS